MNTIDPGQSFLEKVYLVLRTVSSLGISGTKNPWLLSEGCLEYQRT
jgi:hypothetical protein